MLSRSSFPCSNEDDCLSSCIEEHADSMVNNNVSDEEGLPSEMPMLGGGRGAAVQVLPVSTSPFLRKWKPSGFPTVEADRREGRDFGPSTASLFTSSSSSQLFSQHDSSVPVVWSDIQVLERVLALAAEATTAWVSPHLLCSRASSSSPSSSFSSSSIHPGGAYSFSAGGASSLSHRRLVGVAHYELLLEILQQKCNIVSLLLKEGIESYVYAKEVMEERKRQEREERGERSWRQWRKTMLMVGEDTKVRSGGEAVQGMDGVVGEVGRGLGTKREGSPSIEEEGGLKGGKEREKGEYSLPYSTSVLSPFSSSLEISVLSSASPPPPPPARLATTHLLKMEMNLLPPGLEEEDYQEEASFFNLQLEKEEEAQRLTEGVLQGYSLTRPVGDGGGGAYHSSSSPLSCCISPTIHTAPPSPSGDLTFDRTKRRNEDEREEHKTPPSEKRSEGVSDEPFPTTISTSRSPVFPGVASLALPSQDREEERLSERELQVLTMALLAKLRLQFLPLSWIGKLAGVPGSVLHHILQRGEQEEEEKRKWIKKWKVAPFSPAPCRPSLPLNHSGRIVSTSSASSLRIASPSSSLPPSCQSSSGSTSPPVPTTTRVFSPSSASSSCTEEEKEKVKDGNYLANYLQEGQPKTTPCGSFSSASYWRREFLFHLLLQAGGPNPTLCGEDRRSGASAEEKEKHPHHPDGKLSLVQAMGEVHHNHDPHYGDGYSFPPHGHYKDGEGGRKRCNNNNNNNKAENYPCYNDHRQHIMEWIQRPKKIWLPSPLCCCLGPVSHAPGERNCTPTRSPHYDYTEVVKEKEQEDKMEDRGSSPAPKGEEGGGAKTTVDDQCPTLSPPTSLPSPQENSRCASSQTRKQAVKKEKMSRSSSLSENTTTSASPAEGETNTMDKKNKEEEGLASSPKVSSSPPLATSVQAVTVFSLFFLPPPLLFCPSPPAAPIPCWDSPSFTAATYRTAACRESELFPQRQASSAGVQSRSRRGPEGVVIASFPLLPASHPPPFPTTSNSSSSRYAPVFASCTGAAAASPLSTIPPFASPFQRSSCSSSSSSSCCYCRSSSSSSFHDLSFPFFFASLHWNVALLRWCEGDVVACGKKLISAKTSELFDALWKMETNYQRILQGSDDAIVERKSRGAGTVGSELSPACAHDDHQGERWQHERGSGGEGLGPMMRSISTLSPSSPAFLLPSLSATPRTNTSTSTSSVSVAEGAAFVPFGRRASPTLLLPFSSPCRPFSSVLKQEDERERVEVMPTTAQADCSSSSISGEGDRGTGQHGLIHHRHQDGKEEETRKKKVVVPLQSCAVVEIHRCLSLLTEHCLDTTATTISWVALNVSLRQRSALTNFIQRRTKKKDREEEEEEVEILKRNPVSQALPATVAAVPSVTRDAHIQSKERKKKMAQEEREKREEEELLFWLSSFSCCCGTSHSRRLVHRITALRDCCRIILSAAESFVDVLRLLQYLRQALQDEEYFLKMKLEERKRERERQVDELYKTFPPHGVLGNEHLHDPLSRPYCCDEEKEKNNGGRRDIASILTPILVTHDEQDRQEAGERHADVMAHILWMVQITVEYALAQRTRFLLREELLMEGTYATMLVTHEDASPLFPPPPAAAAAAAPDAAGVNSHTPLQVSSSHVRSLEEKAVKRACEELRQTLLFGSSSLATTSAHHQDHPTLEEMNLPFPNYTSPFKIKRDDEEEEEEERESAMGDNSLSQSHEKSSTTGGLAGGAKTGVATAKGRTNRPYRQSHHPHLPLRLHADGVSSSSSSSSSCSSSLSDEILTIYALHILFHFSSSFTTSRIYQCIAEREEKQFNALSTTFMWLQERQTHQLKKEKNHKACAVSDWGAPPPPSPPSSSFSSTGSMPLPTTSTTSSTSAVGFSSPSEQLLLAYQLFSKRYHAESIILDKREGEGREEGARVSLPSSPPRWVSPLTGEDSDDDQEEEEENSNRKKYKDEHGKRKRCTRFELRKWKGIKKGNTEVISTRQSPSPDRHLTRRNEKKESDPQNSEKEEEGEASLSSSSSSGFSVPSSSPGQWRSNLSHIPASQLTETFSSHSPPPPPAASSASCSSMSERDVMLKKEEAEREEPQQAGHSLLQGTHGSSTSLGDSCTFRRRKTSSFLSSSHFTQRCMEKCCVEALKQNCHVSQAGGGISNVGGSGGMRKQRPSCTAYGHSTEIPIELISTTTTIAPSSTHPSPAGKANRKKDDDKETGNSSSGAAEPFLHRNEWCEEGGDENVEVPNSPGEPHVGNEPNTTPKSHHYRPSSRSNHVDHADVHLMWLPSRGWIPLLVDISCDAGEEINLQSFSRNHHSSPSSSLSVFCGATATSTTTGGHRGLGNSSLHLKHRDPSPSISLRLLTILYHVHSMEKESVMRLGREEELAENTIILKRDDDKEERKHREVALPMGVPSSEEGMPTSSSSLKKAQVGGKEKKEEEPENEKWHPSSTPNFPRFSTPSASSFPPSSFPLKAVGRFWGTRSPGGIEPIPPTSLSILSSELNKALYLLPLRVRKLQPSVEDEKQWWRQWKEFHAHFVQHHYAKAVENILIRTEEIQDERVEVVVTGKRKGEEERNEVEVQMIKRILPFEEEDVRVVLLEEEHPVEEGKLVSKNEKNRHMAKEGASCRPPSPQQDDPQEHEQASTILNHQRSPIMPSAVENVGAVERRSPTVAADFPPFSSPALHPISLELSSLPLSSELSQRKEGEEEESRRLGINGKSTESRTTTTTVSGNELFFACPSPYSPCSPRHGSTNNKQNQNKSKNEKSLSDTGCSHLFSGNRGTGKEMKIISTTSLDTAGKVKDGSMASISTAAVTSTCSGRRCISGPPRKNSNNYHDTNQDNTHHQKTCTATVGYSWWNHQIVQPKTAEEISERRLRTQRIASGEVTRKTFLLPSPLVRPPLTSAERHPPSVLSSLPASSDATRAVSVDGCVKKMAAFPTTSGSPYRGRAASQPSSSTLEGGVLAPLQDEGVSTLATRGETSGGAPLSPAPPPYLSSSTSIAAAWPSSNPTATSGAGAAAGGGRPARMGGVVTIAWDIPPFFLPEVRLDISAFTTASVETQESMKKMALELSIFQAAQDALYRQQYFSSLMMCGAPPPLGGPASSSLSICPGAPLPAGPVSPLASAQSSEKEKVRREVYSSAPSSTTTSSSSPCPFPSPFSSSFNPSTSSPLCLLDGAMRHLLHDALPFVSQFMNWRVIYSTATHGSSLHTLYQCLASAASRHPLSSPSSLSSVPGMAASFSPHQLSSSSLLSFPGGGVELHTGPSSGAPMLLLMEVQPSFSWSFERDGEGVREVARLVKEKEEEKIHIQRRQGIKGSFPPPPPASSSSGAPTRKPNRLIIGAYLTHLLLCGVTRRYYGNSDCFVFQLLIKGDVATEVKEEGKKEEVGVDTASAQEKNRNTNRVNEEEKSHPSHSGIQEMNGETINCIHNIFPSGNSSRRRAEMGGASLFPSFSCASPPPITTTNTGSTSSAGSTPIFRVFRSSKENTQFINCRKANVVIGGASTASNSSSSNKGSSPCQPRNNISTSSHSSGGGSAIFLDESLTCGATATCPTFHSPPLTECWDMVEPNGDERKKNNNHKYLSSSSASSSVNGVKSFEIIRLEALLFEN